MSPAGFVYASQFLSDHSKGLWRLGQLAFDQAIGADFIAANGRTVERMT